MTRTSENNAGEIQNGEHETVEVYLGKSYLYEKGSSRAEKDESKRKRGNVRVG